MKNCQRTVACIALTLMVGLAVSGCSIKASQLTPNTHYAYPNANITPLGQVSASTSRTRIFIPKSIDQEMMDEVLTKALKEKGGDLLINSKISTEVVAIPLLLFNVYTTTLKVDGTAAKQVVGQQQLR